MLNPTVGVQYVGGKLYSLADTALFDRNATPGTVSYIVRKDISKHIHAITSTSAVNIGVQYNVAAALYYGVFETVAGDFYMFQLSSRGYIQQKIEDDTEGRARLMALIEAERTQLQKALPKKPQEEPAPKRAPKIAASKKQLGSGGRVRYTYPQEQSFNGAAKDAPPPPSKAPPQAADTQPAAAQLEATLKLEPGTLAVVARQFANSEKLGGEKGFVSFMRKKLRHVLPKHGVDHTILHSIYATLTGTMS